ncbi:MULTISPECIES: hypothetical protein [Acidovorax]|uniref:Uncharacterized protein n=1 Tax=Acidovorax facilis TaxID=12917 RepID=A0ABV8DJ14_9BURK|nr:MULTISPECIES: hypothetical protein [Acidovorax]KQB57329.1 hypothetical protein AE621_21385 [Acidovorax sp. SD340]MBO1008175.1 hypothetical protein [Acidovorax sp. SD340]MCO4241693.1 hypothetical protein [Acidovorax facilis]
MLGRTIVFVAVVLTGLWAAAVFNEKDECARLERLLAVVDMPVEIARMFNASDSSWSEFQHKASLQARDALLPGRDCKFLGAREKQWQGEVMERVTSGGLPPEEAEVILRGKSRE